MKFNKQIWNLLYLDLKTIHNVPPVWKRLSHKGYRYESTLRSLGLLNKLQRPVELTYNKMLKKMLTTPDVSDNDLQLVKKQLPVVVVLGSTASGKSKLAIELAKEVGGEVISADSMQVYEGLNILTNKATEEEMQGIPHHMIGVIDRTEKFDVVKFRDLALPLVEKIQENGKIPFIVGGTNYYIESLLWKVLIQENDETHDANIETNTKKQKMDSPTDIVMTSILQFIQDRPVNCLESDLLANWTNVEIYNTLQQVDPIRALKIHPNDTRKVIRSIQVFLRTGKKHSEIIEEQSSHFNFGDSKNKEEPLMHSTLTPKLGGPLRFKNAICLWIQAERSILNTRIEARVDQMVKAGLRQELDDYVDEIHRDKRRWDFQGGQLQSIGVKEFQSYIQLPGQERQTTVGQKLFAEGLERLKIVTKQYAKRQVQWMKCRFLDSSRRELPPVYGLDGNDQEEVTWNKSVTAPALSILKAHLNGQLDLAIVLEKRIQPVEDDAKDLLSRSCDICDKILLGSSQWEAHMRSAKHRKMVKRKKILDGLTTQVIESTKQ